MSDLHDDDTPPSGLKSAYRFTAVPTPREKMQSSHDLHEQLQREQLQSGVEERGIVALKIEALSQGQLKIMDLLEKLSTRMHDPENGLFTRIKDVEHVTERLHSDLEVFKETTKGDILEAKKTLETIKTSMEPVQELVKWREKVNKSAVWLISGLGTTLIGLLGKMFYDYYATKYGLPSLQK